MSDSRTIEEVEKFRVLLAKVQKARRLPLETLDVGTGLPLNWTYYHFEGEVAIALYDGLQKEPIILTDDFIMGLLHMRAKQIKYPSGQRHDFQSTQLFMPNGRSSEVICARFSRRYGRDLVQISVGGRSSSIYLSPAFLVEAMDRLDA